MINKLELIALKSIALKDPEYFTRKVCRYYSEKFHTPLIEVHKLPWAFVFTNYIEHIIESNNSRKEIYDLSVDICYPEKKVSEEADMKDWIKRIEEEEQEKRAQKIIDTKMAQSNPPEEETPDISMESTSFGHLNKEMEQDE